MRKIIRSKKGITPVLSNVLLLVIAVAGMSIAMTATYVIAGNLHGIMGERLIVEDVWFKPGKVNLCLRNVGKVAVKVDAAYVNRSKNPLEPVELDTGAQGWLNITCDWSYGKVYCINVVTERGTQITDYYMSPP